MDGSRVRRRAFASAVALMTVALLLLAPGALAQSAGDDQYADPLADEGQQEPQQEPQQPPPASDGQPSTPAPVPVTPSSPATSAPTPETTTQALPQTGTEPGWIAIAGLLLLTGGSLLWRRARWS